MGKPFEIPAESEVSSPSVELTVSDQHGREVFFKIKRTSEIGKLFHLYCSRQRVSMNDVRFLYNGKAVKASQRPADLNMADWDYLRVVDTVRPCNAKEQDSSSATQAIQAHFAQLAHTQQLPQSVPVPNLTGTAQAAM